MSEHPLLMSGPLVRATLDGRKTQTRRLFTVRGPDGRAHPITSPREAVELDLDDRSAMYLSTGGVSGPYPCPYGVPGDRLWVRETWRSWMGMGEAVVEYAADGAKRRVPNQSASGAGWHVSMNDLADYDHADWCEKHHRPLDSWRPSIHMPRAACRVTLEVTGVRIERLQDISEEDARAEGVEQAPDGRWYGATRQAGTRGPPVAIVYDTARAAFADLWDHINGDRATWASNPWVWVVTFKLVTPLMWSHE